MTKYFCLLIIIKVFLCSCTKDGPGRILPVETEIGAYTFGCKVDGKIFTGSGKGGLLADSHTFYNFNDYDSTIHVTFSNIGYDNYFACSFYIKHTGNAGFYVLGKYPKNRASFSFKANPTSNEIYCSTDTTNTGSINIKSFAGTTNPINGISGTFEMTVIDRNGNVSRITEGRFDIGK